MREVIDAIRELCVDKEMELSPGEVLWREGDRGDEVAVLLSGVVDILRDDSDGREVLIRKVTEEAILGELALLDGRPRSATIRAEGKARILRVSGRVFAELMRSRPQLFDAIMHQEVDRVRTLTDELATAHQRSITDRMTTLYNYGFFRQRLLLELDRARHMNDVISILLMDVDHFKNYNDKQGHEEGNVALVAIAHILKSIARAGDVVARYGGEEFVMLLYGADGDEAFRIAEMIRKRVEDTPFTGGPDQPLGRVTISGGVATFPLEATDDQRLVTAADENLYVAKRHGRNRIVRTEH
jgi:diguanylate cyclase (GGDEF)-like protein